jgi:hypothetical protein|tara:strand:+ start:336 stop:512 length:177 start_codon:yes stop_codon:yes gene_type:complete
MMMPQGFDIENKKRRQKEEKINELINFQYWLGSNYNKTTKDCEVLTERAGTYYTYINK